MEVHKCARGILIMDMVVDGVKPRSSCLPPRGGKYCWGKLFYGSVYKNNQSIWKIEENMKAHYWIAGILAAYMPLAQAQEVVVLGDSLSDVGQPGWNLKATYAKADGSLNLLYDEYLAQALGGKAAG